MASCVFSSLTPSAKTAYRGNNMHRTVRVEVKSEEIIEAVKRMKKKEREAFLEDLLALTSPVYLESIRRARRRYKAGRVKTHAEVFGR